MMLRRIDLNLLVVFDVLMQEKSASRSAVRLAITETAVGQALERLQVLLGDPLFIGGPAGLAPTARAVELVVPVRETLRSISQEDWYGPAPGGHA